LAEHHAPELALDPVQTLRYVLEAQKEKNAAHDGADEQSSR
jgi:hypothetical protein